jgi:hypothetical protein
MKNWMKRLAVIGIAVILALPVSVALANWLNPPATIVSNLAIGLNPSSVYGMTFQPDRQTFYAVGRHWVFYINNDEDFVYKTALSNGVFGAETELVATTGIYGMEMAVFYDAINNKIHYARHDMIAVPDEVKYRMGTPNANGTITWAAAEQTVAQVPAALLTWRTTITVDEAGYPWVAWIDTDGTNSFGLLYVESSSTKNGTWTEDETQTFGSGATVTDGTGTMTGSPVALDIGANTPTVTADGTFIVEVPIGGSGTAVTGGWVVTDSPKALVEGTNTITVQAGGAGTITINTVLNDYVWFASITPIGTTTKMVEVEWSAENNTTHDVGLYASVFDTDTNTWTTRDTVVAEGSMHATRPDAFSFYDIGSSIYTTYTNNTADVMFRVRSSIQTWVACGAAVEIKASGADIYIPTLSGYANATTGDDLVCIVHDTNDVWYSVRDFVTSTFGAWNLAWTTPAAADNISRHIATYKYDASNTLGFAWQWTNAGTSLDTIQYWWLDNTNDQLGYYAGGLPTQAVPMSIVIPIIFLAMSILLLLGLVMTDNLNLQTLIICAILIFLAVAFLAGINSQINAF